MSALRIKREGFDGIVWTIYRAGQYYVSGFDLQDVRMLWRNYLRERRKR